MSSQTIIDFITVISYFNVQLCKHGPSQLQHNTTFEAYAISNITVCKIFERKDSVCYDVDVGVLSSQKPGFLPPERVPERAHDHQSFQGTGNFNQRIRRPPRLAQLRMAPVPINVQSFRTVAGHGVHNLHHHRYVELPHHGEW